MHKFKFLILPIFILYYLHYTLINNCRQLAYGYLRWLCCHFHWQWVHPIKYIILYLHLHYILNYPLRSHNLIPTNLINFIIPWRAQQANSSTYGSTRRFSTHSINSHTHSIYYDEIMYNVEHKMIPKIPWYRLEMFLYVFFVLCQGKPFCGQCLPCLLCTLYVEIRWSVTRAKCCEIFYNSFLIPLHLLLNSILFLKFSLCSLN